MGAAGAVLTGNPLSGLGAAAVNNVLRRYGNAAAGALAIKASRLGAIQKASQAVGARINSSVASFLSRPAQAAANVSTPTIQILFGTSLAPMHASAPKTRKEAAKQRSRELAKLITDPKYMADRVSMSLHGLEESAPGISGQVALTAAKAVQFLHSRAPKDPGSANTLQPMIDDWEPNDQEVATFERYVRAAFQPLSVLDDLAAGDLTAEGVETVKELYPQLHEMMLGKLSEQIAERKEKLPYEDRINLSLLFGVPADDTMRPDFIARTQAMWAASQQQQPTGGQSSGEIATLGLGDNMRSPAQMLEAKQ
jgi:hypothetical protein